MNCKNCGSPLENNTKFCANCGATVEPEVIPNPSAQSIFGAPTEQTVQPQPVEPQPIEPQPVEPVQPVESIPPIPPIDEPTLEPLGMQPNANQNNYEEEKPKKKKALPIIVVLLILAIAGGLIYYYMTRPGKTVEGLINTTFDKLEEVVTTKTFDEFKKDTVLLKGKVTLNTNIKEFEMLNGETIEYLTGMDYQNKKMEIGLGLQEEGQSIVDVAAYIFDKEMFVSLKDIYSNLIKIDDFEGFDFDELFSSEGTEEDIKTILEGYNRVLVKSINTNDFKKSSTKITLDGKEVSVNKITYELTSERLEKLVKNISKNMLKEEKLLETLAKLTETDVETIKEAFKESAESDLSIGDVTILFDIYTKKATNKFVGLDVKIENVISAELRQGETTETFTITSAMLNANIVTKKTDENTYNTEYKIAAGTEEITGSIAMYEKEIDKNKTEGLLKFDVNHDNEFFGFTMSYTKELGVDIANVDKTKYKTMDQITEQEQQEISTKLLEKISGSKLYKFIEEYEQSKTSSYNYNTPSLYDFDDLDDYNFNTSDYEDLLSRNQELLNSL